jgi:hypothetical protein
MSFERGVSHAEAHDRLRAPYVFIASMLMFASVFSMDRAVLYQREPSSPCSSAVTAADVVWRDREFGGCASSQQRRSHQRAVVIESPSMARPIP